MKLKIVTIAVLLTFSAVLNAATEDQPAPAAAASAKSWAYTPVQQPALPKVKQQAWVRTPIDAFVLAKLETKGLSPSPDADRDRKSVV